VARILIVAGGCRGRILAGGLQDDGHAVRITTRTEAGRAAIEQVGAECWVGTPDRLATLRGALDSVAVVCWLLGGARDTPAGLEALYGPRLELFLTQTIDTTVRGFIYEARGSADSKLLLGGERLTRLITARNRIPADFLEADPQDGERWQSAARRAVNGFLEVPAGI
jgi:hypothetical protein